MGTCCGVPSKGSLSDSSLKGIAESALSEAAQEINSRKEKSGLNLSIPKATSEKSTVQKNNYILPPRVLTEDDNPDPSQNIDRHSMPVLSNEDLHILGLPVVEENPPRSGLGRERATPNPDPNYHIKENLASVRRFIDVKYIGRENIYEWFLGDYVLISSQHKNPDAKGMDVWWYGPYRLACNPQRDNGFRSKKLSPCRSLLGVDLERAVYGNISDEERKHLYGNISYVETKHLKWFGPHNMPISAAIREYAEYTEFQWQPWPKEEEEIEAYVEQKWKRLQAYRCVKCGVRFANEADACREASVSRSVFAVTFSRTCNLHVVEGAVCCVCCGTRVCEYDSNDDRLLTLPLFHENGEKSMKKSPMRVLCLIGVTSGQEGPPLVELQGLLPPELADDHGHSKKFEPVDVTFWATAPITKGVPEGMKVSLRPEMPESFDFVLAVNVFDEKSIRFAWKCCGGNVLFCLADEALSQISVTLQSTLLRDGHVRVWTAGALKNGDAMPPLPVEICEDVRKAIRGHLLYPYWLPELEVEFVHDGRHRSLWDGEIIDDDADASAFITPRKGELQVYRCCKCACRIANEAEICRPADLPGRLLGATFVRTFNLTIDDEWVRCVRCGHSLFPNDPRDPALLTLPLYWDGHRTLDKSPLRVLLYVREHESYRVNLHSLKSLDIDFSIPSGWSTEMTKILEADHGRESEGTSEWSERVKELHDIVGPDFQIIQGFPSPHCSAHSPEATEILNKLQTQDVGIFLRRQDHKNRYHSSWTDYHSLYGMGMFVWWDQDDNWAEYLLKLWMICGGNLVFANWYLPHPTRRGRERFLKRYGVFDPSRLPMEKLALSREDFQMGYQNREPSLAQLIRDRHWLGFWSCTREPPPVIYGGIRRAMMYQQVYPKWLFVRDFPKYQFENLLRMWFDIGGTGDFNEENQELFKENPPFAVIARDKVFFRK